MKVLPCGRTFFSSRSAHALKRGLNGKKKDDVTSESTSGPPERTLIVTNILMPTSGTAGHRSLPRSFLDSVFHSIIKSVAAFTEQSESIAHIMACAVIIALCVTLLPGV